MSESASHLEGPHRNRKRLSILVVGLLVVGLVCGVLSFLNDQYDVYVYYGKDSSGRYAVYRHDKSFMVNRNGEYFLVSPVQPFAAIMDSPTAIFMGRLIYDTGLENGETMYFLYRGRAKPVQNRNGKLEIWVSDGHWSETIELPWSFPNGR